MRNKEFDNFTKTGSIDDYLKYKKNKHNEEKDGTKGRTGNKDNKLSR